MVFCMTTLFLSCSTSRLVDEYINTERFDLQSNKVLIVGLIPGEEYQRHFEYSLAQALEKEGVMVIRSVDYFENPVQSIDQSEENLDMLEIQLLEAGFDAVLFSKITGQESKVTLAQSYRNLAKSFESFRDYYSENRSIYNSSLAESYSVYNTETSLYCICPKDRNELMWRIKIDIVDSPSATTTIRDYVKTLMKNLRANKLLKKK